MLLAIITLLLSASVVEMVLVRQRWRPENWEDAGWMLGHLLLVPTMFGYFQPWATTESVWRTLGFFLVFEFLFYWTHRAMHQHAIPWSIHRTHHTLHEMGTLGLWRAHILERTVFGLCALLACWLCNPGPWGIVVTMQIAMWVQVAAHWQGGGGAWLDRLGWVSARTHHAHHWIGARWNYGHSLLWFDMWFGTLLRPDRHDAYAYGDADVSDTERLAMRQRNTY